MRRGYFQSVVSKQKSYWVLFSFFVAVCRVNTSDLETLFTRVGVKFMRRVLCGETVDCMLNLSRHFSVLHSFLSCFCSAFGAELRTSRMHDNISWFSCSPLVPIDLAVCLLVF